MLHINPLGFHRYASEFLRAAQDFRMNDGFSPVPYYLVCRSIELALKAFLLAKGIPEGEVKLPGASPGASLTQLELELRSPLLLFPMMLDILLDHFTRHSVSDSAGKISVFPQFSTP